MTTQKQSGEENEKWYGQETEAQSGPLKDDGIGKAVVMRFFEYTANPEVFKKLKPTDQEIFNSHIKQIKVSLWGDGLTLLEYIEPRVIRSKKKNSYRIMVTCTPRDGVALNDTPQTLQQLITHNG